MKLFTVLLAVLLTMLVVGVGSLWAFTGPSEPPGSGGGAISVDGSGNVVIDSQIKITGGAPAVGYVLTSDVVGLATWQAAAGGGGGGWVDDGVAVRLETSTDNVGIGTTNPGAKLEVAGQIKITGGAPAGGKILTSDASGLATWQNPSITSFSCPDASWTLVESAGRQLGCMYNDENGGELKTWYDATNYCFVNYGGRLPTVQEWYVTMLNYDLGPDEINGWEWNGDATGNGYGDDGMMASGDGNLLARIYIDQAELYGFRCWIPH
ncbi:MAG: hypothetical protein ABH822_01290 [Patescibacteria group bacterium]